MIVQHQNNVAAFAGAHTVYWPLGQSLAGVISVTTTSSVSVTFTLYAEHWTASAVSPTRRQRRRRLLPFINF